ncbi:RdgB/HAM1 family non-canonical purine NTP pyrophosphatase [Anaerovibrio sp. RM50]|uniref:RdgB/HAM1 family non-canonical purine NTP pyrophosphatase n=1 Tax=Anaerovibrio sp. RM50 TaxID=1200557 RepID=UPI00048369C1|nr:RdgB/HAM1 family non-canonical purine NTP pyrophosphatase [Anaerovibrio sp. RM50]
MKKIIIATRNKGKVKEIKDAFLDLPVELVSLGDIDSELPEPVEDGKTFIDNSLIKAKYYQEQTGMACLADDSGLEVEALGGAPGVYSARYSGENANDASNNAKLVEELKKLGLESSEAAYQCALTFIDTDGSVLQSQGFCRGEIRLEAVGSNGFGYDPYFYVGDKSMAQLTLEEKDAISHRGEALRKMAVQLKEYLQ